MNTSFKNRLIALERGRRKTRESSPWGLSRLLTEHNRWLAAHPDEADHHAEEKSLWAATREEKDWMDEHRTEIDSAVPAPPEGQGLRGLLEHSQARLEYARSQFQNGGRAAQDAPGTTIPMIPPVAPN